MGDHGRMPDAPRIPTLDTGRLRLRGWTDADREPFAALNADPEVAEFLAAPLDRARSDALIDRIIERWRSDGFALFAVERLADGRFLGFVGAMTLPWAPDPFPEIGWRISREGWGQGYATEAAREAMRFAFEDAGIEELVSYTTPGNVRSRRVMEKLGMARRDPSAAYDFLHPRLPEGHPVSPTVAYRLSRTDWEARR